MFIYIYIYIKLQLTSSKVQNLQVGGFDKELPQIGEYVRIDRFVVDVLCTAFPDCGSGMDGLLYVCPLFLANDNNITTGVRQCWKKKKKKERKKCGEWELTPTHTRIESGGGVVVAIHLSSDVIWYWSCHSWALFAEDPVYYYIIYKNDLVSREWWVGSWAESESC